MPNRPSTEEKKDLEFWGYHIFEESCDSLSCATCGSRYHDELHRESAGWRGYDRRAQ